MMMAESSVLWNEMANIDIDDQLIKVRLARSEQGGRSAERDTGDREQLSETCQWRLEAIRLVWIQLAQTTAVSQLLFIIMATSAGFGSRAYAQALAAGTNTGSLQSRSTRLVER